MAFASFRDQGATRVNIAGDLLETLHSLDESELRYDIEHAIEPAVQLVLQGIMPNAKAAWIGVAALLSGSRFLSWDPEIEIRKVNPDDALLSHWESEEFDVDGPPECEFWNASVQFTSELCTHFAVSRPSSSPERARQRALRCAAHFSTECILSPEIGLAVPAAFVHDATGMKQIVAPRILKGYSENGESGQYVRITNPKDGSTQTRRFNTSVSVEYLDGTSRRVVTETLRGPDAFCIQALRIAFSDACWRWID